MYHVSSAMQAHIAELTEMVDARRIQANDRLDPQSKSVNGQFMTPRPVAEFMAALSQVTGQDEVRLLDAGAGVGSLTAAFVAEICRRGDLTKRIAVTAYEVDPDLAEGLQATLGDCARLCRQLGIQFRSQLLTKDFLEDAASPLFMQSGALQRFTHTILNPPYKKINSNSRYRLLLRSMGIETSNLYTGFLAVAIQMLEPGGELIAITPRSFCNGPYFRPFRQLLLDRMAIQRIHIFESRIDAFKDNEVLQENIIFSAIKAQQQGLVMLSHSRGTDFAHTERRIVEFSQIVKPNDAERFIHLTVKQSDQRFVDQMNALPCRLEDLAIDVSTGPVVDFRLKEYLRNLPEPGTVPLIYPLHFRAGFVTWPQLDSRKPNAILDVAPVQKWLYPNGHYVLLRRLSSKEEPRRIVAAVHDPEQAPGQKVGFENHLNVFHQNRKGMAPELARGLAVYLHSTLFDLCFRQFNGHTQVNVKDLYNLRYPDMVTLVQFGRMIDKRELPSQNEIDSLIEEKLAR